MMEERATFTKYAYNHAMPLARHSFCCTIACRGDKSSDLVFVALLVRMFRASSPTLVLSVNCHSPPARAIASASGSCVILVSLSQMSTPRRRSFSQDDAPAD